jgi:divalent metal cation (Fe/Co/Zn/Cd) transporter
VTVILIIIAVLIGTLAVVLGQWPWFWGAVGLVVAALIIGKVLSMMGRRAESSPEHK